MQVREAEATSDDARPALWVAWAVDDLPGLLASLGELRRALLAWAGRHPGPAGRIALRLTAPHSFHDDAANLLLRIYRGEERLAPILQAAHTTLALLEPWGDPVHELDLGAYAEPNG